MNRITVLCVVVFWFLCASTYGQGPITANGTLRKSTPPGGPGSSYANAVTIYASDANSGVASEYQYLSAHFPGSKPINHSREYYTNRKYDVLTFATPDGKTRRLYFDYRISRG
jgi:hypothetical protein